MRNVSATATRLSGRARFQSKRGNRSYSYAEAVAAFWCKLDMSAGPEGCWPWLGAYRYDGYGHVCFQRKQSSAHQRAYQIVHGPTPKGMWVLHSCDNRKCANPAHLRLGTRRENIQDAIDRNRLARGERTKSNKLTAADVLAIRKEYKFITPATTNAPSLARKYGVGLNTIHYAARGESWSHL